MLRNVLDDFLSRATERELDGPLMLLLPAMGFHEVHLIHGSLEYGKDIIAKKLNDGIEVQFALQSKAGNVGQSEWRQIQPQLLQATVSNLGHPNFDTNLPRQTILVTSGQMTGAALLGLDDLNHGLLAQLSRRPITFWDRQNLVDQFLQFGLSGIHRTTAEGFAEHANFFLAYSRALQGTLTTREIESYSRQWADEAIELNRRLLRATVEAEVLAQKSLAQGRYFEVTQIHLALLRVICAASYSETPDKLIDVYVAGMGRLHAICDEALREVQTAWKSTKDLVSLPDGTFDMITYLVHCSRIMEITCLAYFTSRTVGAREDAALFLEDFIRDEPGCSHPLSDRYAVSVVLAVLTLHDSGRTAVARDLLKRATVWLCDRYERGMGLAGIEADELEETTTLLGYAFDFIELPERRTSFLASALADLSAFLSDDDLYSAIVNDIKACGIHPEYWQPRDTIGACSIEAEDVITYPTISFSDELSNCMGEAYGNHMEDEIASFQFSRVLGPESVVVLTALLRDRYYPKMWTKLTLGAGPC